MLFIRSHIISLIFFFKLLKWDEFKARQRLLFFEQARFDVMQTDSVLINDYGKYEKEWLNQLTLLIKCLKGHKSLVWLL